MDQTKLLGIHFCCTIFSSLREQTRSPGTQHHDRPGASAPQELPPRLNQDPEGGGEAVGAGQRHIM